MIEREEQRARSIPQLRAGHWSTQQKPEGSIARLMLDTDACGGSLGAEVSLRKKGWTINGAGTSPIEVNKRSTQPPPGATRIAALVYETSWRGTDSYLA